MGRVFTFFGWNIVVGVVVLFAAQTSQAQIQQPWHQKCQQHYQKSQPQGPEKQSLVAKGGYQAGPSTGALEGPQQSLGINGGEIEIPAIRLQLPRVRLPSLSRFIQAPQMHIDRQKAPLVDQVQQHVSVPTGKLVQPDKGEYNAPNGDKGHYQKMPCQKTPCQKIEYQMSPASAQEMVEMQAQLFELEQRLDRKLELLASSVEKLAVLNQQHARLQNCEHSHVAPSMLPPTNVRLVDSRVLPSNYVAGNPSTRPTNDQSSTERFSPAHSRHFQALTPNTTGVQPMFR